MLPDAWYYNDMGRAVQMKAFQGADGLLHPDDPITREEAFVVLARAFALTDGRSASLSGFSDNGAVSSWASGSLSALVENGYVNGANGRLNPKNNITRAEFAKIITDMAASYADSSSIANQTVDGNLIVRADGASLSGVTVNGDLIIADGGDKVSLDGVKVTGRIVIRGASTEASLKNCSAGKGVLVSNPNGAASLSVSGGSVGTVTAKSDLVVSGSVDNIVIAERAALTVQSGASVGSVTVSAAGASVSGARLGFRCTGEREQRYGFDQEHQGNGGERRFRRKGRRPRRFPPERPKRSARPPRAAARPPAAAARPAAITAMC